MTPLTLSSKNAGTFKEFLPVLPLLDGLRVLLLEDDPLIAMDVEQLCQDHGASMVTTVRTLSGLDRESVATQFDAFIVDLMLGADSTLDFAKYLFDGKMPLVFASGYSDRAEIERDFPGVALIGKPYSGTDLVEAVAASCGRQAGYELCGDFRLNP